MTIVLGNIIALVASLIMVYVGTIKEHRKIIYVQSIQIIFHILSNIILGGITGVIINTLNFIRNIICYKNLMNKITKIIFIILSVTLSILFNNKGIIGLLPVISTVIYIIYIDNKNMIKFKYMSALTLVLWFIYDFYIMNYISATFDALSCISNLVAIKKISKKKKVK